MSGRMQYLVTGIWLNYRKNVVVNVYKYSNTSHPTFYVPEITSGMRRQ